MIIKELRLVKLVEEEFESGKRRDSNDIHTISLEETIEAFVLPHVLEGLKCVEAGILANADLLQDL